MGGAHTLPPSTLNGDRHRNNPGSATAITPKAPTKSCILKTLLLNIH